MAKGVRKLVVALVLAALIAGGVSACGDDGDDSTATTSSSAPSSPSTADGGTADGNSKAGDGSDPAATEAESGAEGDSNGSTDQAGGNGGASGGSEGDSGSLSSKVAVPLSVSGGGSASFREPGGDNSVQDYGGEASSTELDEAAAVLHSFLVARAEEDWAGACSYFSKAMVRQLEQLAEQSSQLKGKGCPPILDALTATVSDATRRALTEVDAASLRRDGDGGFLLYHGAESTDYFMPMAQEGGAWKVSALASTAFP